MEQEKIMTTHTSSTSTSLFFIAVSQKLGTPFSVVGTADAFSSAGVSSVLSLGAPSTSISPFTIWYLCPLRRNKLISSCSMYSILLCYTSNSSNERQTALVINKFWINHDKKRYTTWDLTIVSQNIIVESPTHEKGYTSHAYVNTETHSCNK